MEEEETRKHLRAFVQLRDLGFASIDIHDVIGVVQAKHGVGFVPVDVVSFPGFGQNGHDGNEKNLSGLHLAASQCSWLVDEMHGIPLRRIGPAKVESNIYQCLSLARFHFIIQFHQIVSWIHFKFNLP